MIRVAVRTLWHGQVGINEEKYIKPALADGEGAAIILKEDGCIMELEPDQVKKAQVGRSEHRFHDQFGGPDYYLIYYKWVPTAEQVRML